MIVISDFHLDNHSEGVTGDTTARFPGCNSRAIAILNAIEHAFKYALANSHQIIIIPGDIFHRRGNIPVPLFNALAKVLELGTAQGLSIYAMPGNHDYVDRYAKFADIALHAIYSLSGATIVNNSLLVNVTENGHKYSLSFIPYMTSRTEWLNEAERLSNNPDGLGSRTRLLFAHQSFDGAVTGPHEYIMREGVNPNEPVLDRFDRVISGHYHKHQSLGRVVYVGGLLQHNFGEAGYTPGFLEVSGDQFQQVENIVSPRFQIVIINNMDELSGVISGKDNVILRIDTENERVAVEAMNHAAVKLIPTDVSTSRISFTGMETPEEIVSAYVRLKKPDASPEFIKEGLRFL